MNAVAQQVASRRLQDAEILTTFVSIYCDGHHQDQERSPWEPRGILGDLLSGEPPVLCPECARLLGYSLGRRLLCPYEPKPACKKCETPCYREGHRQQMRRVMKYSGLRLILRGRLDVLLRYFF